MAIVISTTRPYLCADHLANSCAYEDIARLFRFIRCAPHAASAGKMQRMPHTAFTFPQRLRNRVTPTRAALSHASTLATPFAAIRALRLLTSRIAMVGAAITCASMLSTTSSFATTASPENTTTLPRELRVPGGIAHVTLGPANSPKPTATREGAPLWVAKQRGGWVAIVGIPLSTPPGEARIQVLRGGEQAEATFRVKPKTYPVQRLKLNRAMVDPPQEVQARIERESAHLKTVRSAWRDTSNVDSKFNLPANGPLSSRFGVARVLNGQPRSPHAGLDVAVNTGAPIIAPASGRVIDVGEYYFCGNTVFLDHGHGLLTMYCHLSETAVKVGDNLERGARIGLAGATGRATGPHLHWTVYLNGVAVEPELFLPPLASKK